MLVRNARAREIFGKHGCRVEAGGDAFDKNPHLSDAGLNLANGLCAAGDPSGAEQAVRQVLRHNPDLGAARTLLGAVTTGHCSGK
jgi:hypothetical protein